MKDRRVVAGFLGGGLALVGALDVVVRPIGSLAGIVWLIGACLSVVYRSTGAIGLAWKRLAAKIATQRIDAAIHRSVHSSSGPAPETVAETILQSSAALRAEPGAGSSPELVQQRARRVLVLRA